MDRYWRKVGLADSKLWIKVHIDTDKMSHFSNSKVTTTIGDILRYSNDRPLHVTMVVQNMDSLPPWLPDLCDTIQGTSHRWASFSYQVVSGVAFESTVIPPLSLEPGLGSLEEIELRFGKYDGHTRHFNPCTLVDSISSAPNLCTVVIRDSFAPSSHFLSWPWAQITTLTLIGCHINDTASFHDILQQARSLHTLDFDANMRREISPMTLPTVRRFGIGIGRYCDLFTVPRLEHLQVAIAISTNDRLISGIHRMVQRSNVSLKGITIREVNLGDVTVERFLRVVGSEVKELIIEGMVFDHLFHCIASEPHDFLPNLEILKIRSEDPTRSSRGFLGWPNIPCELSPPLEAVVSAARSEEKLKTLELELLRDPSESSCGISDDSAVRGQIEDLERNGISVHIKHLDIPRELKGLALDRLGKLLESTVGLFSNTALGLHENMPVVDNLFRIVEKYIQEGRMSRETVARTPMLRAAMTTYAYRNTGAPRDSEFNTRERAKVLMRRLNEIAR
ncbi:hypothetical protein V5O48_017794 [Marasmius crinis-equi]|uniref:Uncharacterized protein n=1 Tax=Marasmius crinis-equi TaxID=585013 RepID=A0ABR3EN05_9AGAR